MSKHKFVTTTQALILEKNGGYSLKKENRAVPSCNKWHNKRIWLSDGEELQYKYVKGKKVRLDRPNDYIVDSQEERKYYFFFKQLEKDGFIKDLEWNKTHNLHYEILPTAKWKKKTYRKRYYTPDFRFISTKQFILNNTILIDPNKIIIIEVKSKATIKEPAYSLRRQLFLIKHIIGKPEIDFFEVTF